MQLSNNQLIFTTLFAFLAISTFALYQNCAGFTVPADSTSYHFTKNSDGRSYSIILDFLSNGDGAAEVADTGKAVACKDSSEVHLTSNDIKELKSYASTLKYCGPSQRDIGFKPFSGNSSRAEFAKPSRETVEGKWDDFEKKMDWIADQCKNSSGGGAAPTLPPF